MLCSVLVLFSSDVVAQNLYNNLTYLYPDANIWMTGHSLGGALASLLGVTFGAPTLAIESPGEKMAATRLHLPSPVGYPFIPVSVLHVELTRSNISPQRSMSRTCITPQTLLQWVHATACSRLALSVATPWRASAIWASRSCSTRCRTNLGRSTYARTRSLTSSRSCWQSRGRLRSIRAVRCQKPCQRRIAW